MEHYKELNHCINLIQNIADICSDEGDSLYVIMESFVQKAQKIGQNEQDIMHSCRAAVACLIGALVPHEYFDSFMEDIGLLEDEIYDEKLLQEVQDE